MRKGQVYHYIFPLGRGPKVRSCIAKSHRQMHPVVMAADRDPITGTLSWYEVNNTEFQQDKTPYIDFDGTDLTRNYNCSVMSVRGAERLNITANTKRMELFVVSEPVQAGAVVGWCMKGAGGLTLFPTIIFMIFCLW